MEIRDKEALVLNNGELQQLEQDKQDKMQMIKKLTGDAQKLEQNIVGIRDEIGKMQALLNRMVKQNQDAEVEAENALRMRQRRE